jgi:hypothetical protein
MLLCGHAQRTVFNYGHALHLDHCGPGDKARGNTSSRCPRLHRRSGEGANRGKRLFKGFQAAKGLRRLLARQGREGRTSCECDPRSRWRRDRQLAEARRNCSSVRPRFRRAAPAPALTDGRDDGFVCRRGRCFDFCTSGLEIWPIAPRTALARFLVFQTKPPYVTKSLELLTRECYPPLGLLISNLLGLLWTTPACSLAILRSGGTA